MGYSEKQGEIAVCSMIPTLPHTHPEILPFMVMKLSRL